MPPLSDTKIFTGLRLFFAVCFSVAVLAVITVYYPLLGTILFLAGLLFLVSKSEGLSARWFSLCLFGVSLLIHLAAVAFITTPIVSDFATQYEASRQFAQGDFSFQESSYFQRWGYQTGLVIWQGLLLKIWDSPTFLRLVNCLVSAGTNVLLYLIARDYFAERAARLASLAYAFFLYPATLVTVLCNNIPSAFFLFLCLYLVMGKRFEQYPRLAVYAGAGASLALANALRPDAPLVLVPLLAYFIFRFLSKASWKNFLAYLQRFLALFLTFLVLSTALSALVRVTGVNAAGLDNHDPLWGVVVGTNPKWQGVYHDENGDAIAAKMEEGLDRTQAELAVIQDHVSTSPIALVELAVSKLRTLWWDRALGWSMSSVGENYPTLYQLLQDLDRAMFTCALVLAAWGAVSLFRRPKGDFKAYLIPFVIFAACCVYLVMEVQPRYAYVGQIALFILMAGGVEALCSLAAAVLQKRKLPHKKSS